MPEPGQLVVLAVLEVGVVLDDDVGVERQDRDARVGRVRGRVESVLDKVAMDAKSKVEPESDDKVESE